MIEFKKKVYKDRIVEGSNVIQEGTPINAELFNRYESLIEEIVSKVNDNEHIRVGNNIFLFSYLTQILQTIILISILLKS